MSSEIEVFKRIWVGLTELGFTYSQPSDQWVRERDGAKISWEAIEGFVQDHPTLIDPLLKILSEHPSLRITSQYEGDDYVIRLSPSDE